MVPFIKQHIYEIDYVGWNSFSLHVIIIWQFQKSSVMLFQFGVIIKNNSMNIILCVLGTYIAIDYIPRSEIRDHHLQSFCLTLLENVEYFSNMLFNFIFMLGANIWWQFYLLASTCFCHFFKFLPFLWELLWHLPLICILLITNEVEHLFV